jgi:NTP pyrophosphatase (non-canonical NTP hydrolase)
MNLLKFVEESARTEKLPETDTVTISAEEMQYLNTAIKKLHEAAEIMDKLKRQIFYGDTQDLTPYEKTEPGEETTLTIEHYRLLHSAMGIATEASEYFHGLADLESAPTNEQRADALVNMAEELSDILWYMAIFMRVTGLKAHTITRANIAKLRERYPDAFNRQAAVERDKEREMAAFRSALVWKP